MFKDAQNNTSTLWKEVLLHINTKKNFLTLGRLCCIEASARRDKIYLIYDVWEGIGEITEDHFNQVYKRYVTLKKVGLHNKVQQYQAPKWPASPDFIYSPYVAAIIHDFLVHKSRSQKKAEVHKL